MPTDRTIQKNDDADFFQRVGQSPTLVKTLSSLGFSPIWYYQILGNAGMGISRPDWNVQVPAAAHALNIHFEARCRTEFRIEIGPEPHVSSVSKKPELLQRFLPLLARRADIMDALRNRLLKSGGMPGDIVVTTSNLLPSTSTAAHTIVKFQGGLPGDPTTEQSAAFFSRVIEVVTPIVCGVVREMGSI